MAVPQPGHLRTFALACTWTFERLLRLGQETSSPERHHKGARSDVAETRDTAIRLDWRFRIKGGDTIIVVYGSSCGVSLGEMQGAHRTEAARDGRHNTRGLNDQHHYDEFGHQGRQVPPAFR